MITEDYVSFEVAKLLKEKGFDEECSSWYSTKDSQYYDIDSYEADLDGITKLCPAPTQQMAMKWLREVHRIDIEVRTHYLNYLKPNDIRYYGGKILKGNEDIIHTVYSKDTYEEVCEAAIKYCLENLI